MKIIKRVRKSQEEERSISKDPILMITTHNRNPRKNNIILKRDMAVIVAQMNLTL